MNHHLKLAVLATLLMTATPAVARDANVCQLTAQDGLSSCVLGAQSNSRTAAGMCVNVVDAPARRSCNQTAKANFQSALTICGDQLTARRQVCKSVGSGAYNPVIDPANFTTNIDNTYFPLKPGTTFIYEGPTSAGSIRTEFAVTSNTKIIEGVTGVEVHDQVFTDGQLTEDTLDWFAQDKDGNVWYLGEDSDELVGDRVSSLGGSWVGGVNNASPGIVMKAHPAVGDFYRQEFLLNTAEDAAGVLSLDVSATVPAGTFDHCLKTKEITGLEPGALEYKFYAPGIGNVLTVDTVTGDTFPLVQIVTK